MSMAAPGSKGFPVPSAPNSTPADVAGPDTTTTTKFDQEDLRSTLASYPEASCAPTPESAARIQPQALSFDSPLPMPKEFGTVTPRLVRGPKSSCMLHQSLHGRVKLFAACMVLMHGI
jgi:hypothetical protein